MSRYERYGTRSLVYSKWHRFYLGDHEPMIDLDGIEYCAACSRPLVLIETARDVGQANKPTTVLRRLAEQAGVLALCVLYLPDEGVDLESGCACEPGRVDDQCAHGIARFRVRRVWPPPENSQWQEMSPAEFRDLLLQVRLSHAAAEHGAPPETVMWRDVRPGDVLDIRGSRWRVVARDGAELTLRSQSGKMRTGRPNPRGAVTIVERAPRDEATEAAVATLKPLKPEPLCSLWLGAAERYCGSDRGVRRYLTGYRCAAHAPVTARCAKCKQPLNGDPGQRCLTCGNKITKAEVKR